MSSNIFQPEISRTSKDSAVNIMLKGQKRPSSNFNKFYGNDEVSADIRLNVIRTENKGHILISHLNINSLQNKFEALVHLIKKNVDILVISETKIDHSFPTSQFLIDGFSPPFRKDRDSQGGGYLYMSKTIYPANC